MNKKDFIQVLHHFSDSSVEEAQEVVSLKESYPYSQLLHALSARVCKDHGFVNHHTELQLAAVYASDRAALKDIMDAEYESYDDNQVVTIESTREVKSSFTVYTPKTESSSPSFIGKEGLADEVIHDLEKLHELRHNFELMFVETSVTSDVNTPTNQTSDELKVAEPAKEDTVVSKEKTGLSKRERIIALAKEADQKAEAEAKEKVITTPISRKKKEVGDLLIDEIVSSKKEIDPETEKQKEQIDLINQFIQAQPSISSREKLNSIPAGDLSTIKSGEFGDNIVSETLVDILIKQGKKDKAIEVLKKLIWKFPQKKAYFAAQIEELKK